MPKRLSLPGGSFLEIDESEDDRDLRRERLEGRIRRQLEEGFSGLDPDAFAAELQGSVNDSLAPYLHPREDPIAEVYLENAARPRIEGQLRRLLQEEASETDLILPGDVKL